MTLRVPTSVACRISGIRHDKLNRLIAHDAFPWAPETPNRAPRTWDIDDITTMRVLQELIFNKVFINRAVTIANSVGAQARDDRSYDFVAYVEYAVRGHCTIPLHGLRDFIRREDQIKGFQRVMIFNVGEHRRIIEQEMNASLHEDSEVAA